MKLTFQTKTRSKWFNNACRFNLLRLWSPWLHGDSSTRDSLTCIRQTPCAKPTCFTCLSPSDGNHVRNLTTALNTTTSTATVNTRPAPPTNHWISKLTSSFQDAVLINNVRDLKHINAFYDRFWPIPALHHSRTHPENHQFIHFSKLYSNSTLQFSSALRRI